MNPKALYQITYGLYWLSVRSYGQDNACIINTAVQVASDPLRITISENKGNKTHDMIMDSGRFNVCALTTDTPFSLFQRFGMQSGRDVNKFVGFEDVQRADNGLLVLTRYTNAYFSAKLSRTVDLGSHTLLLQSWRMHRCSVISRLARTVIIRVILSRSRSLRRKKAGFAACAAMSTRGRNCLRIMSARCAGTAKKISGLWNKVHFEL